MPSTLYILPDLILIQVDTVLSHVWKRKLRAREVKYFA